MGGNIFKGKTQGIKKEYIEITVKNYFEELKKVFPKKSKIFNKKHFKYLGSVGKKPVSGDIDFGIDILDIIDKDFSDKGIKEWNLNPADVKKEFEKLKKRARTSTDSELMTKALLKGITVYANKHTENIHYDEKKVGISGMFSLYPQYDEKGNELDFGVQIDWMIADIKLLQFSYFSTSYKGNVKGLHRTQLILSMFQNLGLSFSHMKGLSDKETKEIITTDPTEMLKILSDRYKVKITRKCSEDYFCLINIVIRLKDKDNILGTYLKILDYTRADIPDNLQTVWKERKKELGLTGKFLPPESKLYEGSMLRIALSKINEDEESK